MAFPGNLLLFLFDKDTLLITEQQLIFEGNLTVISPSEESLFQVLSD
jgi:hypothetical protein